MTNESSVHLCRVQCEHYDEPLGIEEAKPRISWVFEGDAKDWTQSSYELRLLRGEPNVEWQEVQVESAESVLVDWPFEPLRSQERVTIAVRSHGRDGTVTPWESIGIEAGLLSRDDWRAIPITCENQPIDQPRRPFVARVTFDAPREIHSARLYITSMGVYEPHLNGQRIGQEYLAPGWTSYHHRLVYRTYDVTGQLVHGKNVLGAWIGEGWYTGRLAFRGGWRNNYGERPALIAQLHINGQVVTSTGDSWKWSYGPLILSELLNGEVYDAGLVDDDWATVAGSKKGWKTVETLPATPAAYVSTQSPPVRAVDTIRPISVHTSPRGKIIIDFGQNFAGVVRIIGSPPASSPELIFRHAEVLEHCELGTRPLRHAAATDRIILRGRDVRGYEPKFTSHGFRYVEVEGWEGVTENDLLGVVTQTAMRRTGHFSCSHALLNRLHQNVVWSTIGNTISLPTDCPQRDERLGWTGDIQVFSPTMSFLFDTSGFLCGWLKDLYVDQLNLKGNVPVTVPDILDDFHNQRLAIWGDTAVLTPHDLYTAYADTKILEDQYASAKLWLKEGVIRNPHTGLWDESLLQLSDWLAPQAPPENAGDAPSDPQLVANSYLIHTTRTMAEISRVLGKADAQEYQDTADGLLKAFYDEYVTPNGRIMSNSQTALALLIHFRLVDPARDCVSGFGRALAGLVEKDNWKVATGFAGTPIILHALEAAGLRHHAYRMLLSQDTPSWLSPVLLGATTIWERWDSMLANGDINPGEMTSFNHYALGSVASFLHSVVGGLAPGSPGWRQIVVHPRPGGNLTSAVTSFVSPYGYCSCRWEWKDGQLLVDIVVPPNCTAEVLIGENVEVVGSGKRHFSVPWVTDARFPPKGREIAYGPLPSDNWAR